MKFHTKRYDITKTGEDFDTAKYEVNLKNGYVFTDGTYLNYAEDYEDLRSLIADIVEDK